MELFAQDQGDPCQWQLAQCDKRPHAAEESVQPP